MAPSQVRVCVCDQVAILSKILNPVIKFNHLIMSLIMSVIIFLPSSSTIVTVA